VSGPAGVNLNPNTGVLTWSPTEQQGPSTNVITVRVTDNGTPALSDTKSFTVVVTELNSVPALILPPNQTAPALSTLVVTNRAVDADVPTNTFTFSLVAAPAGAKLDPVTGVLAWTPTASQAGSTNVITVKVTDNGTPPSSGSGSFTVIVTQPNTALVLGVPTDDPATRAIREIVDTLLVTNTVSASAPAVAPFAYSLVLAPTGVNLNPGTGLLAWTPTEEQGPSTNVIIVRVTDSGVPALSDTKSFTVLVNEVNVPPVLAAISDRTNYVGETVSFTATASDSDIPANTLTFTLGANAPAGAVIDPNTGSFLWTIPGPDNSTNNITVVVTDNGSPALSSSRTFAVVGIATNLVALDFQIINGDVVINFGGIAGGVYRVQATPSLSPPIQWSAVSTNVASTTGLFQFVDSQARNFPMRFYRAINP